MEVNWRDGVINRFGVEITWAATYDRVVICVDGESLFTLNRDEAVDMIAGMAYQVQKLEK